MCADMFGQDWDSMYYNNLLSIPVLVVFSAIFEDWSQRSLQLNLSVGSSPIMHFILMRFTARKKDATSCCSRCSSLVRSRLVFHIRRHGVYA